MKRFNCLLIGLVVLSLATVSLAGCVSKSEYEALQADYNDLKANYETVEAELAQIKEVYPAKNFRDGDALEAWLQKELNPPTTTDAIRWYAHGLQLQERALEDGYIISVILLDREGKGLLYEVFCYAVLEDGSLYWWDPETDDIYYWLDVKHF